MCQAPLRSGRHIVRTAPFAVYRQRIVDQVRIDLILVASPGDESRIRIEIVLGARHKTPLTRCQIFPENPESRVVRRSCPGNPDLSAGICGRLDIGRPE